MADSRNDYHQPKSSPANTKIPSQPFPDDLVSDFEGLSTNSKSYNTTHHNSAPRSSSTASGSGFNGVPTDNRFYANSIQPPATRVNGFEMQGYVGAPMFRSPTQLGRSTFTHGCTSYNHMNGLSSSVHPSNFHNYVGSPNLGRIFPGNSYNYGYQNLGLGNLDFHHYILKQLASNDGENPRVRQLLRSPSAFIEVVQMIADEVNTPLGSCAMKNLIKLVIGEPLYIAHVMCVIKFKLLSMMLNQHGSSVIQYFLHYPYLKQNEVIYETAVINCIDLATTKQGCISLKAVIKSIGAHPLHVALLCTILNNAAILSEHRYGNYVVQDVLDHHPYTANQLFEIIRENLFRLSMDMHGSPVIEKCISSAAVDSVVLELLSDSKQLVELAQDKYGNYVIQKALKETKGKAFEKYLQLVDILRKSSSELENHPSGRNVYNLIKRACKFSKNNGMTKLLDGGVAV
ncbi:pumilio homolog 12-like [Papaver somniferum]|uniref:pumilio homolog 12-like n=1 Tax=Papaver somniferum TaxID=3469 RepID=UPI000E6F989A|nr:pumilio homolog 12-like [Papaver somniferum]